MGKLYLPNVHTIKSYTEYDEKDLHWRIWPQDTSCELAFAGGRLREKDDFFGTADEAITAARRERELLIARTERSLARLKSIQEKAVK